MSKPKVRFIVIDEVSEIGRRAFGPFSSFREAAFHALKLPSAYVLPLEYVAVVEVPGGPSDRT